MVNLVTDLTLILTYQVDTFFAVGSALGEKGKDYMDEENIIEEMLVCRQMFNIFHPYDPVAYRVEPLVCKEFLTVRPVIIPYHRGGKRLHIWVPGIYLRCSCSFSGNSGPIQLCKGGF
ncbi:phospholipase SGR2-like [Pistacia vera]|uniref:phospholipase SGR2-like n=1 Tax=Pistacia vera TaxID=55513 RepID=UPI001262F75C|nr:phospholipase SGR2-like [Pistacia vera]